MRADAEEKIYRINCLTEEIDAIYHQAAVKFGVSDSVLLILYMLYTKNGRRLLPNIYKTSGISKQTVNSAIRKLEKEEIVYLENYDGKSKIVCLTEKGKAYAAQTAGKLFAAECELFNDWKEEEIDQYLKMMEKYNTSLRNQIGQIPGKGEGKTEE